MEKNSQNKSYHILNTSATILGICVLLITSLKFANHSTTTILDELLITTSVTMYVSCFLSYLAIRNIYKNYKYEQWADYIFMFGLLLLLVSIILTSFDLLK